MRKEIFLVIFVLILAMFAGHNAFVGASEDLEIVNFYSCDRVGNPQYYFPVKTKVHFNLTIRNLAINPKNVSIYLCVQDELEVIIGSEELSTTIPANVSVYYVMGTLIPQVAFVGPNAMAQVSVFESEVLVDTDTTDFFIYWEDETPPVICILFPENLTYTQSSVPLTFTIGELTSVPWLSYCLDGVENTTIAGNTTLTDLSDSLHNIIVYANDTSDNTGSSNIVYFTVSLLHDVAVVDLSIFPREAHIGQIINITVVIQNNGTASETFNVKASFNDTNIQTQNVINLPPENQTAITFDWNTTNIAPSNYTIKAYAEPVVGEIDTTDNTLMDWIVVTFLGDINGDWKVDIKDLVMLIKHFGSYQSHPRWNPNADLNYDSKVDIKDLVLLIKDFGEYIP